MATPEISPENSKKKVSFAQVLVPVAAILAAVIVTLFFMKRSHEHEASPGVVEGKKIADLDLYTLSGDSKKLSSLPGKVILINFWATWCGPCIREMPSLDRLYKEYKTRGLEVVAVSVDDDAQKRVPKFFEKIGVSFASYVDQGGKLSDQMGVEGLPFTLIIDAERKVLLSRLGDDDWFSQANRSRIEKWLGVGGA